RGGGAGEAREERGGRGIESGRDPPKKEGNATLNPQDRSSLGDRETSGPPGARNPPTATGCSSAQQPIMIGKAAIGVMPRSASVIMHGAYRPMPSVISAPSPKHTTTATAKRQPDSASASPPPGSLPSATAVNTDAAISSAMPMPIWIDRRGRRLTTPAPSQAPSTELVSVAARSIGSMTMDLTNRLASATPDAASPTLSVPGISS